MIAAVLPGSDDPLPNDSGSRSNSSGLKIKLESRICNTCHGLEEGDERMEEIKEDCLFLLELGTRGVSGMRKTQGSSNLQHEIEELNFG